MPEQQYSGFTPDPTPSYSGFTPDPPTAPARPSAFTSTPPPEPSWYENIFTIPNALRFGGSALGTGAAGLAASTGFGLPVSLPLAGAGGAAGEAAARWWEGKPFDLSITGLEGLLNLLPGGGALPGKGAALKEIAKYGLRQAGHGAWQGAAGAFPRHWAEQGNLLNPSQWESPSLGDIASQTAAGTIIGGATGTALGAGASRFGKPKVEMPPIKPPVHAPAGDIRISPEVELPPPTFKPPVETPITPTWDESISPAGDFTGTGEGPRNFDDFLAAKQAQEAATTPAAPAAKFDPATLGFEGRTQEVEFVNPKTGEVRGAAEAQPGDVPIIPEEPSSVIGKPPAANLREWMDELMKGESGEFDFEAMRVGGMNIWRRLREALGRDPSVAEMEDEAARIRATVAPKPGELTGKVADFPRNINKILTDLDYLGFDTVDQAKRAILQHDDWAERWPDYDSPEQKREIEIWRSQQPLFKPSLFKKFITEEEGSLDLDRLKALFQKQQEGTITPEELAEAARIAKTSQEADVRGTAAVPPKGKITAAQRRYFRGKPRMALNVEGAPTAPVKPPETPVMPKTPEAPKAPRARRAKVNPQEAGTGNIAKAANEPPRPPATPEEAAANVAQAEQAVTSLNERMRRAVENPDPANAAKEIENLLDEATEVINKVPDNQKSGWIRKALGVNKALLTSWDLSAPGRQGKAFILNKAWWTSLDDMVRAWGSQKAAQTIAESITDHKSGYFRPKQTRTGKPAKSFAEEVGLDLAGTEEIFSSKGLVGGLAGEVTGITRASRAHTAFLNKLRADQFVSMMDSAKKAGFNPEKNLDLARSYAKFINDATGRGSLNVGKWKLERNVGMMNDVFFAPKNMSGQIRTWNGVLNPMKYWNYDPVLRKQALRSLFAVAGSGLAVGELARQMGARVSNDPYSSDFRKIKIGDTRIDLFGGYQQFPVAAMKFIMGKETPTSGRDMGRTIDLTRGSAFRNRQSVAERFFTNRLSPAGSFVWAWMSGREFDGMPFEAKRALYERTAPIVMKDLYDLAKEDPALAAAMAAPSILGLTGTQTYGR